jgi:uncharacterized protein (DUF4415 family)
MSRQPQRKAQKAANRKQAAAPARKAKAPAATSTSWVAGVSFTEKEPKLAVSLRLDADVLRFFRGLGAGYQTRINEVLRVFMDAHQKTSAPATSRRSAR